MLSGLVVLALQYEQLSQTLMGRDKVRLNAQRLVKIIRGFGVAILGGKDAAEIITGFGGVGRQAHRLLERGDCLVDSPQLRQGNTKIEMRSAKRGIERDRFFKVCSIPPSISPRSASN